ncbi:hypothetical protein [Sphingomonas sp.]|uniref:hypothetical protein n=1 Tax=Sphingomonas sp. TaxID=28214 RepID=UPI0025ED49B6|nr:hypothetical protein [Sphingomonas sp.]
MSNGKGGGAANQNGASNRSSARRTVEELGENPVALVAGGVALGVLIGMLVPRVAKERELLDPLGRQLADRATAVAQAAKEAGKQEIDTLLPGKDATKERVSALFGNVLNAAKEAAKS